MLRSRRTGCNAPVGSWARFAGSRGVDSLLYQGQISAALTRDAIPVQLVWTRKMWEHLLHCLEAGHPIAPPDYPGAQNDLTLAIRRWVSGRDTALVVGSVSPWVEAILYSEGCRNIFTLDIRKVHSEVNELQPVTYREWMDNEVAADVIVSFSTVEHFGLGRYGDERDPQADIKWMREFASNSLHSDGVQLLAVPVAAKDSLCAAHRIYGPGRLARLVNAWRLVETVFQNCVLDHVPFSAEFSGHDWQKQPVLVLRPEQ